jgi:signal transduction histidine kinase
MIRNLLENARRHGAPPIDVRVRDTGGSVELTVCDHGPGVPEAEGEDVFRPFHRVGGTPATTGGGLGLTLVRQIARRHGGEARYLGRIQAASCFAVSLPRATR